MKKTALIVDDEYNIRKLILMTMEFEDFQLYEAENGDDAWRVSVEICPNIVLMDVMMPGTLDGYQVCAKIKSSPLLGHRTKVVLLTARGQKTDIEKGKSAGCDAYLVKPFSPLELLGVVERLTSH